MGSLYKRLDVLAISAFWMARGVFAITAGFGSSATKANHRH
jgi:hypothetical protein